MAIVRFVNCLGLGLLALSCGDNTVPEVPCWPLDSAPGGSVELGTGELGFEPMPASLMIQVGAAQGDPFVVVNARIRGIAPGSDKYLDPTDPATFITASIPELQVKLANDIVCPAHKGYLASTTEAGAFDLTSPINVGFGHTPLAEVSGKTAHIVVEVVGTDGHYAKDEKDVVVIAPADAGVDAAELRAALPDDH